MKQSLGLLEVSGLALAITCADVMAKAAAVTLLGFEKTNGSGWTLIKIAGDVASVQAAVISGASTAEQHQGLVASRIIARPATGLLQQPAALSLPPTPARANESTEVQEVTQTAVHAPGTCNLCLDPDCKCQKGEPRNLCLHAGK